MNLYGYVHSNSLNRTDPLGLLDPIIKQDPIQYNQDLQKISCENPKTNPWLGIEPGANAMLGGVGYGISGGFEFNPLTGQICMFGKSTPRVGLGLYAGAGIKGNIDFQDREQSNGESVQPELAIYFAPYRVSLFRVLTVNKTYDSVGVAL